MRKWSTKFRVASGHCMYVEKIRREDLPSNLEETEGFETFYVVRNWDAEGCVFLYLGKGYKDGPEEICAWYPTTGAFWTSYGNSLKEAIEGAQRDGWMYA